MDVPAVDLAILEAVFRNMAGRVEYHWGGKAPDLAMDSHGIEGIDCSGFVQFALARATGGKLVLPQGSWQQREWCEAAGLHKLEKYADVKFAANDPGRLFIAFIKPAGKKAGHVWLVRAGHTMESYGEHGVGARKWNAKPLPQRVCACFELPVKKRPPG